MKKSFLFCAAALLLTCTKFTDDNPLATGYAGDYRLSLSCPSGALVTGTVYRFGFTRGADYFDSAAVETDVADAIDSAAIIDGADSVAVRFAQAYESRIVVTAWSPNRKYRCSDSCEVTVVEAPVCGDAPVVVFATDTIRVASGDSSRVTARDSVPGAKWYVWKFGGADSVVTEAPLVRREFTAVTVVTVYGVDACGNAGPVRSTIVKPEEYAWRLTESAVRFPSTVQARRRVV